MQGNPAAGPTVASTLSGWVNQLLEHAFRACSLPFDSVRAVRSKYADRYELQCNDALPLAKRLGLSPRDVATPVAAKLRETGYFELVDVSGPGFINLRLSASLLNHYGAAQLVDPRAGIVQKTPQTVVLDYGGPNVAKPLHVGHLRSLVVGESLRRILCAQGYHVLSDAHLGDWGLQMGMLIAQIRRDYPALPCFLPQADAAATYLDESTLGFGMQELQHLYPRAAAACKADPERMAEARKLTASLQAAHPGYSALWRAIRSMSLHAQQQDFSALDAHFDMLMGESDVHALIPSILSDLRERGLSVESEGAWVVEVAHESDTRPMPPLILAKSDGAALYATTDLATIFHRVRELAPVRIIYVVDQRQALHFEQVFRTARKAGYASGVELIHAGFGTVNGRDGKPYKTRQGGVAKLVDLLESATDKARERLNAIKTEGPGAAIPGDEEDSADKTEALARLIGIAAVKFADLSSYRVSGYIFDPERMVSFEGKTGPYVQYACVRVASILSNAAAQQMHPGTMHVDAATERALVFECTRFPEVVASASSNLAPNEIADYVFNLAQIFSRFYLDCAVLTAGTPALCASRLAMCALARHVLSQGLYLLGIAVPEKM